LGGYGDDDGQSALASYGNAGGPGCVRILAGLGRFPSNAAADTNEALFTTVGTGQTWTVPAGVTSVSVVCRGGGANGVRSDTAANGGGGGGLRYYNNLTVTPGASIEFAVGANGGSGANTWFNGTTIGNASVWAQGGQARVGGGGSTVAGSIGGFNGGSGGLSTASQSGGGGGAGGYTSVGGNGGSNSVNETGSTGIGGGAGGNGPSVSTSGQGGGSGLYPGGPGNLAVVVDLNSPGQSSGSSMSRIPQITGPTANTVPYGAGGAGNDSTSGNAGLGSNGAIRVIWPGTTRLFPYSAGK
jgi:hypothetical protein